MNHFTGLQKALLAAGSVAQLAVALGVTQKTINVWLAQDGVEAPPETQAENTGVRQAVTAAGSRGALARHLGVSLPAVQGWVRQGWVPPARAQEIENSYGIPRAILVSPKVRNALGLGGEL